MVTTDTELAVGYLVKRVQQALRRRCDSALRPSDVSMSQYAAMRALADHPEASAAELARLCFVTRQSFQDLLAGLQAAGFVRAADVPLRGRARSLELTPLGARRLKSAHAAVMGVDSAMLQGVSDTAQRQLAAALIRCAENLENE